MKIIYFVTNGNPEVKDIVRHSELVKANHKVYFSNGSLKWGFEDSCNKVLMSTKFDHIVSWCEKKGIDFEVVGAEAETEVEVEVVEESDDAESEARAKYELLFGKKAGNMKLEKILAKIEEAELEAE